MAQFQWVISLTSAPQVLIPADCRMSLGSKGGGTPDGIRTRDLRRERAMS